ncbi:hypothetical protein DICPUDRAFT_29025 [Dictyostelium purpureum]|uniref:FAD-binding PCMH-type domain-containing protein n=1 Tax=Dictyostelium purpureum TaxID=5786 RepID=F0ZCQ6_DICPU|nr:uncharacterized protein DICPUDRAFT_29025 [Dictyostelium purpureum]EGC38261.1 hypothetical protein DICPUDRAFT_29025 [Dictyostelium purpureum]|eukprot:XP_003285218.1 hypothetical protein DICPUDRAFT_29025 [Dictyostelium purpureum]
MDKLIIVKHSENKNYYSNNQNGLYVKNPFCYIKVFSYDDIRNALKYAKSINKGVSIRNSGHSCINESIQDDSVNIDMSELNRVLEFNIDKAKIKCNSAVKYFDFYKIVTEKGLACPGGGCGDVCVGGLVLGGGSNYLAPKWGTASDCVLEMTVMLADESIITCSKTENVDLFWALRGAGHSGFAILLDVTFQLYPIEPLLYFNIIKISPESFYENLDLINNFTKTMDTLIYISIDFRKSYRFQTKQQDNSNNINKPQSPPPYLAKITYFYNGKPDEGEKYFLELLGLLKGNVVCEKTSYLQVQKSLNDILRLFLIEPNQNNRAFTKCRINKDLTPESIDAIKTIMKSVPQSTDEMTVPDIYSSFSCTLYYHGGQTSKVDTDESAYIHRKARWSVVFMCNYIEKDNDQCFNSWRKLIDDHINSIGEHIYQNYPDDQVTNWESSYYGIEHYKKLQSIKLKYDPTNYFNFNQSIKLP